MAMRLVIEYKTEIASTKFQNPSMSHKMDERLSATTFLLSKSVKKKQKCFSSSNIYRRLILHRMLIYIHICIYMYVYILTDLIRLFLSQHNQR